ncbi:MAG TPA: hypothetical protein VF148_12695 [Acidimicrobiia bacterium]
MSATGIHVSPDLRRAGRRFGYGVAIAINVAMLIVVQYILDWGRLAFLTDEFADVVPWISLGLVATIVANLVYQFNDTRIVKSTGQILTNLISIFVTYQVYLVFPFDFSGSTFNWEVIFRILLVLAMVGAGIGVLVEAVKLASSEFQQERR